MTNGRILGSINLPTASSAIGVWHIDEAFLNIKNGTWPTAPVPQPYYAWEATFGVTTVGSDGVTVDSSPVSGNRVKSWTSTNGRLTLSQATATNMPIYYAPAYGKPYIQMNGSGTSTTTQYLQTSASLVDFDNLQQISMGVAMRQPGAYYGYRNDVYASFNYGWAQIPCLMNITNGATFRYGGDSVAGGKFASLPATYDPFGETTIFGTFSTTATSQASANAATSTGRIYLNGVLNASDTTSTTTTTTTNTTIPFNVGRTPDVSSSGLKQFYGVYLYKRELTATQVAASHADISGRFFSWTTLPVTGSVGWWDASRVDGATVGSITPLPVTANNGAIDTFVDLSNSSRNATQSTSSNRPTRQISYFGANGLAAIALNGTSQFFEAAWSNYTDLTLFIVAKNTNASALGSRIFSQSDATLADNVQTPTTNYTPVAVTSGPGSTAIISTDTSGSNVMGVGITNATPLLIIHRKTGSTGSNTVAGTTTTGTIGSITRTLTKLTLGRNTNGSDGYWAGSYYEIIAFGRALTTGEETTMKNYIQSKWGVS
jgi:hypothetical protein